jgi:hypothetical protein
MKIEVTNISFCVKDEDGLSYIHCTTTSGYYSVCRYSSDEQLYVELNNPSSGRYLSPDYFEYIIENGKMSFYVDENRNWDLGIYQNITLIFEPLDDISYNSLVQTVRQIFI